jgi:hypothetical protein
MDDLLPQLRLTYATAETILNDKVFQPRLQSFIEKDPILHLT